MSAPTNLSRPLADRVRDLPPPAELPPIREPSAAVIEAAVAALEAGHTHYTDRPGILPLRRWVAGHLTGQGVPTEPDAVTITCGLAEARFVTVTRLCGPGGRLACASDAVRAALAPLLTLNGIEAAPGPAAGTVLYLTAGDAPQTVADWCAAARQHDLYVIWQAPLGHTAHPAAARPELAARTVTIGSVDDTRPGWRIGWMAGSDRAGALRAYKQSMTICTPSISQWGIAALDSGETTETIETDEGSGA